MEHSCGTACFYVETPIPCQGIVQATDNNQDLCSLSRTGFQSCPLSYQASTGQTTGKWFVQFYAPWCGHCTKMAPVLDEFSLKMMEERTGVIVAKVDATKNHDLAKRFEIRRCIAWRVLCTFNETHLVCGRLDCLTLCFRTTKRTPL